MREGPDITTLAALIGDPARSSMLVALMSGMALTAGELAREAGITPQTASTHLAKLVDAALIVMEVQGRHRYFRLAGQEVAGAIEGLMALASRTGQMRTRPGPRDAAMRQARACYDHFAGSMAVAMHDALIEQGYIVATRDGLGLSPAGRRRFVAEGLDLEALDRKSGPLCRACLDWSERRHHLAGSLGAALLALFIQRGWARRDGASRAIVFTPPGQLAFERFLAGTSDKASAVRA